MHGWRSKTLVLILLGFAATDFVITKTLSAADAAVHMIDNHYFQEHLPDWLHSWGEDKQRMAITILLLMFLCAMFLRGFKEVIGLAVGIVALYLVLNAIVIGAGLLHLWNNPQFIENWQNSIQTGAWEMEMKHRPFGSSVELWAMVATCLLIFPKLALGLSGFETGCRGHADGPGRSTR